jgi:hypothetical protein
MWNHFHTKICQFLLQEPTNVSKKTSSLDIMFGAKLHANPRLVETTNINMVRLLFVYNVHLVVPIPFQLQLYDVCTNPTSWNNHLLCNLQQCDQIAHALAHCDFGGGGELLYCPNTWCHDVWMISKIYVWSGLLTPFHHPSVLSHPHHSPLGCSTNKVYLAFPRKSKMQETDHWSSHDEVDVWIF